MEAIIKNIPLLSGIPFEELEIQKLSGLSNKNFLISTPAQQYVLRIPREATNTFINRADEIHNADIAQQLSISPKCLWRGSGKQEGISLTEFINNAYHFKIDDQKSLEAFAKTLTTLHHCNKVFKGTLDNHKLATYLKQYFEICTATQQNLLEANYKKALSFLASPLCARPVVPSHIDLVPENILLQNQKIWLIDWEYSAMASPFLDIATVCNSYGLNPEQSEKLLNIMLKNTQESDFKSLKNYRFIMKTVSDCWEAAFI